MRLFDWFFRDRRTSRITIAQLPNLPLWIFIATVGLRVFLTSGAPWTVVDWVGAVALGWWAVDEVVRGVNPWRRVLGAGVCVLVASEIVSLIR